MAIEQQIAPARAAGEQNDVGEPPVLEIVGGPGRLTWSGLREYWLFRDVQLAFVTRQLKVRYKQAALGAGWVILQPLAAAAVFALFLGRFAHVQSDGLPYLLFALAGTAAWGYFSNAANTGAESLVGNQTLLRKIYFPREILPLAAVLSGLVDLAIGLCVLFTATFLYGIAPAVSWVALPIPVLTLAVFAGAVGLGLSSLNIYYRDVRYVLPFLLQIGLFASPIAYPLSIIPAQWRQVYAILNPIAGAVDAIRSIVTLGRWPDWTTALGALGWSVLLLLLALLVFKRLERGFADRV
jgi:lipopolysaccharide transport system permease protein